MLLGARSAAADGIPFRTDPAAPEMASVVSVYGKFIKAHPGMRLETAMVDLEGQGVASIAVRFVSPDTCRGDRCDTVVLHYSGSAWRPVFDHSAVALETAPPDPNPSSDGMSTLVVDGKVRWVWCGFDRYMPDLGSLGHLFPAGKTAAPDVARAARAAMGSSLQGFDNPEFTQSPVVVDAAAPMAVPAYWVRAYAAGLCGNAAGCPHTLLVRDAHGLKPVWTGFTIGPGAVLSDAPNGLRDVALAGPSGYGVLRYDGTQYREFETSYPSGTTPAP